MAQTVSNDALWEKLSEIEKKLEKLSVVQNSPPSKEEKIEIKPDFDTAKKEIITVIKETTFLLGKHSDNLSNTNIENLKLINENILKIHRIVTRIQNQQKESAELLQEDKNNYFIFRFFKIRKTTLIIVLLGLLVFILTLFCMKQQNDYSILNSEYLRQSVVTRELETITDLKKKR